MKLIAYVLIVVALVAFGPVLSAASNSTSETKSASEIVVDSKNSIKQTSDTAIADTTSSITDSATGVVENTTSTISDSVTDTVGKTTKAINEKANSFLKGLFGKK